MTKLTKRQEEILRMVCKGLTSEQIGHTLGISRRTVDVHLSFVRTKYGVSKTTAAAVQFARERGCD